jgi:hypothetical protein
MVSKWIRTNLLAERILVTLPVLIVVLCTLLTQSGRAAGLPVSTPSAPSVSTPSALSVSTPSAPSVSTPSVPSVSTPSAPSGTAPSVNVPSTPLSSGGGVSAASPSHITAPSVQAHVPSSSSLTSGSSPDSSSGAAAGSGSPTYTTSGGGSGSGTPTGSSADSSSSVGSAQTANAGRGASPGQSRSQAQESHRLRQLVQRDEGCLSALPPGQAQLLVLRADLGGPSPRSAAAVARILHISAAREAGLERSALSALISSARGGCPASGVSPRFVLGALNQPTGSVTSVLGPGLSVTAPLPGSQSGKPAGSRRRPVSQAHHRSGQGSRTSSVKAATAAERASVPPLGGGSPSHLWLIILLAVGAAAMGTAGVVLVLGSRERWHKASVDGTPEPTASKSAELAPIAAAPRPERAAAPTPEQLAAASPPDPATAVPGIAPAASAARAGTTPGQSSSRQRKSGSGLVGATSVAARRAVRRALGSQRPRRGQ